MILCKLFKNLLSFYDLDYTLNVFKHEVNDNDDAQDKELLKRIGLDVNDSSRPFIFQLLEREDAKNDFRQVEDERPVAKIASNNINNKAESEVQKKGAKIEEVKVKEPNQAEILLQKDHTPNSVSDSRDFKIQRPPEKLSNIKEQVLTHKTESEIKLTEENPDEDDENDIFLGESQGIDITVDSEALKQFDYDESLEDIE